jgi:hypothetical protein
MPPTTYESAVLPDKRQLKALCLIYEAGKI